MADFPSDALKNDFQNSRRRNLHNWSRWRSSINNTVVKSGAVGQPGPELRPLDDYLDRHVPQSHPARNPKALLSYSADRDTETCLRKDTFLVFGLPRVHVDIKPHSRDPRQVARDGTSIKQVCALDSKYGSTSDSQPSSGSVKSDDDKYMSSQFKPIVSCMDLRESAKDLLQEEWMLSVPDVAAPPAEQKRLPRTRIRHILDVSH